MMNTENKCLKRRRLIDFCTLSRTLSIAILFLSLASMATAGRTFDNGSFPELKFARKGHFYIHKYNNRYLFVTPDGYGFYPIGINHLNVILNTNLAAEGESESQREVLDNMRSWGFNCGGYGTNPNSVPEDVYFIGSLNMVRHGFYHLADVHFPDVFDDAFGIMVEETFRKSADMYYQPERLIGMVWSDLPSWNIFKSRALRQTDWVSEIRKLPSSAPGKKAYVKFLKEIYRNKTDKLLAYYNLPENALNDLDSYDFSKLYLGHPMVMKDDQLFMDKIAAQYYRLGAKYHAKYFPNIPLLGDRYLLGDHPDSILQVASSYVDAISIQVGDGYGEIMPPSFPFPESTVDHIYKITGKPVVIADHQISFYTGDYKSTTFSQAGSEQDASNATVEFLETTYSRKHVLGYFRCTYLSKDEPFGRGVKQGLCDFNGIPYPGITSAYSTVNSQISNFAEN